MRCLGQSPREHHTKKAFLLKNDIVGLETCAYSFSFKRLALPRLPLPHLPFYFSQPDLLRVKHTHARPRNHAALAFVPFGIVLALVRLQKHNQQPAKARLRHLHLRAAASFCLAQWAHQAQGAELWREVVRGDSKVRRGRGHGCFWFRDSRQQCVPCGRHGSKELQAQTFSAEFEKPVLPSMMWVKLYSGLEVIQFELIIASSPLCPGGNCRGNRLRRITSA